MMISQALNALFIITLLSFVQMGRAAKRGDVGGIILYNSSMRLAGLSILALSFISLVFGALGIDC